MALGGGGSTGAGAGVGVRAGVLGAWVGAACGRSVGMLRGPMITPSRISTGPCGAGVGVGVGSGRLKLPGELCAASGTESASVLADKRASAGFSRPDFVGDRYVCARIVR